MKDGYIIHYKSNMVPCWYKLPVFVFFFSSADSFERLISLTESTGCIVGHCFWGDLVFPGFFFPQISFWQDVITALVWVFNYLVLIFFFFQIKLLFFVTFQVSSSVLAFQFPLFSCGSICFPLLLLQSSVTDYRSPSICQYSPYLLYPSGWVWLSPLKFFLVLMTLSL